MIQISQSPIHLLARNAAKTVAETGNVVENDNTTNKVVEEQLPKLCRFPKALYALWYEYKFGVGNFGF